MRLVRLAWKNILGNGFRSLVVALCAALVAGLALSATFVVRGAEASLRTNLQRLGADILVLPWGTMTENIGGVRLMSAAIDGWMPRSYTDKIAALDGVAEVSPQWYLGSLVDTAYSAQPEIFIVAYDPATDFALKPWLEEGRAQHLAVGDALVGTHITIPDDSNEIPLYGHRLQVVDRLEPTATTIDSTVFINFETAEQMIAWSKGQAKGELNLMPGSISAIMVNVALDSDPHRVAVDILEHVPGVVPLETPDLFQTERQQMAGVLRTMLGLLGVIWALTLVFLGLVFSVGADARRWDIGVLRALGFPRALVLKVLLMEGSVLALAGGFVGVMGSIAGFVVLRDEMVSVVKLPLQIPSPWGLLLLSVGGQTVALLSVALAAFIPAWRISQEEVALSMRE